MTSDPEDPAPGPHRLRVAELRVDKPTPFDIAPGKAACAALAETLGLLALRKLRFTGQIAPAGSTDWRLEARIGATVVQPCVLTLAPVTTRVDQPVIRNFVAHLPDDDTEGEVEMPDDETLEALGAEIDLDAVLAEALALALPLYPRAEGAALKHSRFAAPGVTPMRDEDARPFAGLAGLRDKLVKDD